MDIHGLPRGLSWEASPATPFVLIFWVVFEDYWWEWNVIHEGSQGSCKSQFLGKKIRGFWCEWVNLHEGLSRFSNYEDFVQKLLDLEKKIGL